MRYYKRKTLPKKTAPRRVRKYTARKGVSKSTIKKMVKRAIAANVENKEINVYTPSQPIYPSVNANFNANIRALTPNSLTMSIQQGTSQSQRIGNQIKIKDLKFKYTITPNAYNAASNAQPRPSEVIVWIFYDRLNPTVIPTIGNDFLQLGGSSQPLQNNLIDTQASVNNDRWRLLYKKVHKVGFSAYNGTGTLPSFESFTNNDYKLTVRNTVNLTKHIVKTVKFDDNDTDPTSRGLFICFQAVASLSPYNTAEIPCTVASTIDCIYEDA